MLTEQMKIKKDNGLENKKVGPNLERLCSGTFTLYLSSLYFFVIYLFICNDALPSAIN